MIYLFSILIMMIAAYAQYRAGLFMAIVMLIQVFLAGLIAFDFYEPIASALEPGLQNSFMPATEDFLCLTVLFCGSLALLRFVSTMLCPDQVEHHGTVQKLGAAFVGLWVGYLTAGFLICLMQTLPMYENFLGFEPRASQEGGGRSIFPPDRVWLTLMRDAGAYPLNWRRDNPDGETPYDRYQTFDRYGTFELRHLRYRRRTETRSPLPYAGEFDREIYRKKN